MQIVQLLNDLNKINRKLQNQKSSWFERNTRVIKNFDLISFHTDE